MITDLTRFYAIAATCMLLAIGANAEAVAKPPVELAKPPVELAKPSAEVAKNTTGKVCAEGDGPATNTTIFETIFSGMNFTVVDETDALLTIMDTNKNGLLERKELDGFAFSNGNLTAFFADAFKDYDLNGDEGINAVELHTVTEAIINVTFTGCVGLCNAVKAKLDSCHFFEEVDMANATAADVERGSFQKNAQMLVASCHLGSPDFDKFGKCVKKSPCDDMLKCVKKARRCAFGMCATAQIGSILPHSGNVTAAIRTDEKSVTHQRAISKWVTAATVLFSSSALASFVGIFLAETAVGLALSVGGVVLSIAAIYTALHLKRKPFYISGGV